MNFSSLFGIWDYASLTHLINVRLRVSHQSGSLSYSQGEIEHSPDIIRNRAFDFIVYVFEQSLPQIYKERLSYLFQSFVRNPIVILRIIHGRLFIY